MNALLKRILNIIANDAFPDEDKPYIIREVVSSWNEAKVPGVNETWYDEKYVEQQKEFAFDKGFKEGVASRAVFKYTAREQQEHDKSMMKIGYEEGRKDGMREGFKLGVHTGDTRHKEELDKVSNDKWLEGYNQAKEEYAAEVLGLTYKHEQALEVKWREGYNEGRAESNPTAIHSAEYLKFCEDKAYKKGYQQGRTENGEYYYGNGYTDGLEKGRDMMRGDALYLDGYQAGRKAGANEVVNTINKINRGLDT